MFKIVLVVVMISMAMGFTGTSIIKRPGRDLHMDAKLFEEATIGNQKLSSDSLKRERYVASNRFNVKNGAGPKFEKRCENVFLSAISPSSINNFSYRKSLCSSWADRESRLAELPGFRFFGTYIYQHDLHYCPSEAY